jgi:hypothetical protein
MSLLRQKSAEGGRAALAAFGLPAPQQPGLKSVGIKTPHASDLPHLPRPGSTNAPSVGDSMGVDAAKIAFNVGMGASTSSDGAGAQAGEPTDTGRRQRSVIDRALQRNDDDYATSSMPLPGDVVSP